MAELTGRHVATITVGGFAIIIAVNLLMAFKAVSTFPGLEAKNTYVASQEFDLRRHAQEALGWTVQPSYAAGHLRLAISDAAGQPVEAAALQVLVGRPTSSRDDQSPEFSYVDGGYEAVTDLAPGLWMLKLSATAKDGTLFEQRFDLYVKG